jgi:hypothetical protein
VKLHELMRQLNAVEEEYRVATTAILHVLKAAERDPTLLHRLSIEHRPLRLCLNSMERTYIVRLFAVFEENLRDIWSSWGKRSRPKTEDLLKGCSSRRKVAPNAADRAHVVRVFRNSILHGGRADAVTLAEARSSLCEFLGWMPLEW